MKKKMLIVLGSVLGFMILSVVVVRCISATHTKSRKHAYELSQSMERRVPVTRHEEKNSVYYWKTVLDLNDSERQFLRENEVKRAYVRFFDVVPETSPMATEEVIPNATLQMKDSLPVEEIVPTVYITLDAMKRLSGKEYALATKILARVSNMMSYNDLGELKELQLDCDWTESTEESYFKLCKAIRELKRNDDFKLSSTIRLHQLSKPAPPVDYGVLMLYNTGSIENPEEENSILSEKNVKPYVKNLSKYPLHLDFAYPAYTWQLLFRDNEFLGILRDEIPSTSKVIRRVSSNRSRFVADTIIGTTQLKKGDIIRYENSDTESLLKVKEMVENEVKDTDRSTVIYHLDSKNLSNYSKDEIQKIYK